MIKIPIKSFLFSGIMFLAYSASSQVNVKGLKNALFVEVSSRGPVYSINYERTFKTSSISAYNYRAGFSIEKSGLGFPIGLGLVRGKNAHHPEVTLVLFPYIKHYNSLFNTKDSSDKVLYIVPSLGYRYQKWDSRFFIKAAAAPLLLLDPPSDDFWKMKSKIYPSLSITAGVRF